VQRGLMKRKVTVVFKLQARLSGILVLDCSLVVVIAKTDIHQVAHMIFVNVLRITKARNCGAEKDDNSGDA
jgi:hypothetical protein